MKQNYKISISYDGTNYHGWQRQPDQKTIQGLLEEALFQFRSQKINVIGAGRTDAGVHALAQVAHFKADFVLSDEDLFQALNAKLPEDIRIIKLERVDNNFHARQMVKSKVYQYRIFNSANISPFIARFVHYYPAPLNITKMKQAGPLFEREADFSCFSSNRFLNPARKVLLSKIEKKGDEILYTVEATGFLKYMVRTMVGTLLEIGKGKMKPDKIEELFYQKKRSLSSPTAPAKGLCLLKVNY